MSDQAEVNDDLRAVHEAHGAVFETRDGREVVARYCRPPDLDRTHRAVRNGVGVTETPTDVIVVEGADRVDYLDNVLTSRVPATPGRGAQALLLDPQGRIETTLTVYTAEERVLLFLPPGRARPTADGWETFIQDVDIRVATDEFVVLGVHGPEATRKVASVLAGAAPPEPSFAFDRGSIADVGVTVARTAAPLGEVGYEVVCPPDGAGAVFEALVAKGGSAVPFGRRTWSTLSLEAGTPAFEAELEGRIPNVTGSRAAVDFEKGCFVGQEVVSKVENRGRPSQRLVGLRPEGALPEPGAAVTADGRDVGEVTRAARSPMLGSPIALAYVPFDLEAGSVAVATADGTVSAGPAALPFVEGSEASGYLPRYPETVDG